MMILAEPTTPVGVSLSTAQIVIGILGTLGLGAVGAAVVTGLFSRKKLGADATEIISRAAAGVVERTEADNARLRADLAATELRLNRRDTEIRRLIDQHTRVLQLHAAWDHVVVEKCKMQGIELPPPPPLYGPETSPGALEANPQVP